MAPLSSSVSKRFWVGDSRFVGISKFAQSTDEFICESSMGLVWFKNTAIPKLRSELKNTSGESVILAMGVNDLGNIDGYIKAYSDLMREYTLTKFFVVSVNPVVDSKSPYAKNSMIESFNAKLKGSFSGNYIDVYNQIKGDVESNSSDGIHYNDILNKKIYDIISSSISNGTLSAVENTPVSSSENTVENNVPHEVIARPIIITKRYEYYSGKRNSNVISFTFEFQGICVDKIRVGDSLSIDHVKNEMVWVSGQKYTGRKAVKGQIMGLSSSSLDNLEKKSKSMWILYSNVVYGATLEIMGDPTVKVGTYCLIAVYTKYGLLHHTSGIYYIKEAQDSISGGNFTTTLTLRYAGNSEDNARAYLEGSEDSGAGLGWNQGTQNSDTSQNINQSYNSSSVLSDSQKTLVDIAESNKDKNGNRIPTEGGYCAKWVEDVYHAAGLYTDNYGFGNAIDYWNKWKSSGSSDMSLCIPGSCVVGSGTDSSDGNLYGHIGIYLGNGKIADNIGRHRVVTVDEWRAFNTGHCGGKTGIHGWCWPYGKSII